MNKKEMKKYLEDIEDLEKFYSETFEGYGDTIDWEKNDKEIEEGEMMVG